MTPLGGGEAGVLVAYGRRAEGFALCLSDGRLSFDHNLAGRHVMLHAARTGRAGRWLTGALIGARLIRASC